MNFIKLHHFSAFCPDPSTLCVCTAVVRNIYSWSLFCFRLITEGVQSRLQRNSRFAFQNHLFGIPTIFEKNFSSGHLSSYNITGSIDLVIALDKAKSGSPHTVGELKDLTNRSVSSKTTLITSCSRRHWLYTVWGSEFDTVREICFY